MTKVVTAVAALRLIEAGRLALDEPVERWLPELADRRVLTSPSAPLDDTVPARRSITVRHLLTLSSGYGMEFGDTPLQKAMAENGTEAGPDSPVILGADEWLARLAELPLHSSPERAGATTTRSLCSAFSWPASRVDRLVSTWPTTCSSRSGCRTPRSGCRRGNSTGYPRRTDMASAVSWRWSRQVAGSTPGRRPSMSATASLSAPPATFTGSCGCWWSANGSTERR